MSKRAQSENHQSQPPPAKKIKQREAFTFDTPISFNIRTESNASIPLYCDILSIREILCVLAQQTSLVTLHSLVCTCEDFRSKLLPSLVDMVAAGLIKPIWEEYLDMRTLCYEKNKVKGDSLDYSVRGMKLPYKKYYYGPYTTCGLIPFIDRCVDDLRETRSGFMHEIGVFNSWNSCSDEILYFCCDGSYEYSRCEKIAILGGNLGWFLSTTAFNIRGTHGEGPALAVEHDRSFRILGDVSPNLLDRVQVHSRKSWKHNIERLCQSSLRFNVNGGEEGISSLLEQFELPIVAI